MPNTNFQTFHQMGSAISDFVKQATGRDNVQNIDMDHVTVAQNHVYDEVDVSGRVVHFSAGAEGIPFEKCIVQIEPVQSGSGVPSPDNIRPITGWTMVNVYQAGQSLEDVRTFRFTFPSEAGVVYGGTLDVVSGELVVDRYFAEIASVMGKSETTSGYFWYTTNGNLSIPVIKGLNEKLICNRLNPESNIALTSNEGRITFYANGIMRWKEQGSLTLAEYGAYLANNPLEICYELATPQTYQLTPQEITTLLGQNNIWADTGDIEVKFTNLKELY